MPASRPLKILVGSLGLAALVVATGATWFHFRMRASLPPLDGRITVTGLSAPVGVTRDSLGVPTIQAANRLDVARALGFVHAQDRFFQMDLLRRSAAGELSALLGASALPVDRAHRLHEFRRVAREVLQRLPADQLALVQSYAAGVNAGLASLRAKPFEYYLLRADPAPWLPEDTVLTGFAMALDQQGNDDTFEQTLGLIRDCLGPAAVTFFASPIGPADAALDGTTAPLPPIPGPAVIDARRVHTEVALTPMPPARLATGSNALALTGDHTATGAAMIANDMHLGLSAPGLWYRASLRWGSDSAQPAHSVTGVTLPGLPFLVAGSNGSISWGFTNSYADTADLVLVERNSTAPEAFYSFHGRMLAYDPHTATIDVKGGKPVTLETRWTEWGPIVATAANGSPLALHWLVHDPAATDFSQIGLETATTTAEAVRIAHRAGSFPLNILIADRAGNIAWTICGRLPARFGHDGRTPVTWAYDDRGWHGLLPPDDTPTVIEHTGDPSGRLWSGNARQLGGEALTRLGDAGYITAARAARLRDDLAALDHPATPADLLAIQLDDATPFYTRWQQLLVQTLSAPGIPDDRAHHALRDALAQGTGHASVDDRAHLLVRTFRYAVARRVLGPIFQPCIAKNPDFNFHYLAWEEPLWRILDERPAHLLGGDYSSWDDLLRHSADDVLARLDKLDLDPSTATWGDYNRAAIHHPLAPALPSFLAHLFHLDLPADPLPGDENMPRVQHPSFGASERFVVSPGHEAEGIYEQPAGESGHPLSPYFTAGHEAWVQGRPTPFLPGPPEHTLQLTP